MKKKVIPEAYLVYLFLLFQWISSEIAPIMAPMVIPASINCGALVKKGDSNPKTLLKSQSRIQRVRPVLAPKKMFRMTRLILMFFIMLG